MVMAGTHEEFDRFVRAMRKLAACYAHGWQGTEVGRCGAGHFSGGVGERWPIRRSSM
jgi:hypothetical protein